MGYDATCTLKFDGKTSRGTAQLEHKDLVFRGTVRLAIPLATITAATARGGTLYVQFGGKSAELAIGSAAEKWARRITSPPSRLDKLGVKPGMTIAAIDISDEPFLNEVAERADKVTRRAPAPSRPVDLIFYGAEHRDALGELPSLVRLIKPDGAIWIVRPKASTVISARPKASTVISARPKASTVISARPKGRPEITEAETMAAGKRAGLVDVKVVSFSETHTAEKFVIPVAKRPRR